MTDPLRRARITPAPSRAESIVCDPVVDATALRILDLLDRSPGNSEQDVQAVAKTLQTVVQAYGALAMRSEDPEDILRLLRRASELSHEIIAPIYERVSREVFLTGEDALVVILALAALELSTIEAFRETTMRVSDEEKFSP